MSTNFMKVGLILACATALSGCATYTIPDVVDAGPPLDATCVRVRECPEPLPAGQDEDSCGRFLNSTFIMHGEWPGCSTEDVKGWKAKYRVFGAALVEKANRLGFDGHPCRKCLKSA